MQNLTDFIIFKVEKCHENLCTCYRECENGELPVDYAECPYYHNNADRRREPFEDIITHRLAYQHVQPSFKNPDPEGCLNEIEYIYHPMGFKAFQCKSCPGFFCPFFHTEQEKLMWDKILKRGQVVDRSSSNSTQDLRNERSIRLHQNEDREDVQYMGNNAHRYDNDMFEFISDKGENQLDNGFQEDGSDRSVAEQTAEEYEYNLAQINLDSNQNVDFQGMIDQREYLKQSYSLEEVKEEDHNNSLHKIGNGLIQNHEENWKNKESTEPKYGYNKEIFARLGQKPAVVPKENKAIEQKQFQWEIQTKIQDYKGLNIQKFEVNNLPQVEANIKKQIGFQGNGKVSLWPKNNIPFTYGTTPYVYGELIPVNEDRRHEFKAFKGHQYFDDLIEKYVCGFLNSKGGTIYLGVVDDGRAFGIKMDRRLLDELSISFDRKLKSFYPPVRADQYKIVACPVYDEQSQKIIKDHYVIEIHVEQGDPYELHFNDKKCCYIRKQASSIFLQPEEIKMEIRARTRTQMAINLLGLIGDSGFEEGLKRQTTEDLKSFRREFEDKIKLIDELLRESQEREKYDELVQKLGLHLNI